MKRIEYIDIFRSIGIILMVLGHIIDYHCLFSKFFYAFHMPMFFFISGYLFNHKSKEKCSFTYYISKKIKTLLIPYLFFGLLGYIIYIARYGYSAEPVKHLFYINDKYLPISEAIWFLSALFFADIIFFLSERYIKNRFILFVTVFIVSVFGCIQNRILNFDLPFSLGQAFVGLGFIYIGFLYKTFENKYNIINSLPFVYLFLLTIVSIFLIFKNNNISMYGEKYGIIPLFWFNAVIFSVLLLYYSKIIYSIIKNNRIVNYLCSIGENSIIYLGLNQILICIFHLFLKHLYINDLLFELLLFFLTMTALYYISIIFKKTELKKIIGKF